MRLKDICELIVDCEHKTAPTQSTGYPSIRTPNIGRGYFMLDSVNRVSEETYKLWTRRAVPKAGDLIMAREAPVGNVALVPVGLNPCLGQRTLLIRPKQSKVHPAFLNYLLNGPVMQQFIQAKTNGATVPHLNMKDVRTLELPELPSLPVQRHLAGILSAYDELIENSQRRTKILESMARAIFREWFVHFRFPGHESVPRVPSALGEIPQGWEVVNVKDIATVTYGFAFASKQFNNAGVGVPVVRIRDIPDGASGTYTEQSAEPKFHICDGHILVGMDGDFHMCIWANGHALQNQRVARFESSGVMSNFHLFLALEKPISDLNRSIVGTTVAHLGDSHIKILKVLMPPSSLLVRATDVLEPLSQEIILLKKQIRNLRSARDLLLPRLMSGLIDVEALS